MKKYVFVDIDGTLTNSKRKVSKANIKAINDIEQKKEFEIVFCSGRNNDYLVELSKKCNTSNYIISSNGSMVYNQKTKKVTHKDKIPFKILNKIYEYCKEHRVAISFNTEKCRYCNDFLNYDINYKKKDTKRIRSINDMKTKNITQFVMGSYNYEQMLEVKKFLNTIQNLEIVNISTTMKLKQINSPDGFFYDVVIRGVNKGTGISNFIKKKKIDIKNCIAIGDHINDIDMFKAVGYKIAMGNACDELKEKADFITKTNDEDGVKYALEHLEKEFNKN